MKYEIGNLVQKRSNNSTREGLYSDLELLPDYTSKWKYSFFDLHRDIAETHSKCSLSNDIINRRKKFLEYDYSSQNNYSYINFVVHCRCVIPSAEGPILYLEDPFGSILSNPLKESTLEEAKSWVKHMLVVEIGIHYINEDYPIKSINLLDYTLYDN